MIGSGLAGLRSGNGFDGVVSEGGVWSYVTVTGQKLLEVSLEGGKQLLHF